jgi:hypothetical protein
MRAAPFARSTYAAGDVGRFYVGISDKDEIGVYDGDGNLATVIRTGRESVAVPKDGARRFYSALYPNRDTDEYLRRSRAGFPDAAPQTMPVFDGMLVDSEKNLWVRRYQPPWVRQPSAWDLHDSSGRLLGTVTAPLMGVGDTRHRDLLEIGDDYSLVLSEDTFGVLSVTKHHLAKGSQPCE